MSSIATALHPMLQELIELTAQLSAWTNYAATCIRVHISRRRRASYLGFCTGGALPAGAASSASRLRSACFARTAAVAVRFAVLI